MTDLRNSQTVRQSVVLTNPALHVSQTVRQSVINPFVPLHLSQIVRMTIIQLPQVETLYCWARQTDYPDVTAVTPLVISPAA